MHSVNGATVANRVMPYHEAAILLACFLIECIRRQMLRWRIIAATYPYVNSIGQSGSMHRLTLQPVTLSLSLSLGMFSKLSVIRLLILTRCFFCVLIQMHYIFSG